MIWQDKTWAKRRQLWILFGLSVAAVLIISLVLISVLYKSPSCMDLKQNQNEQGVDCGGSCRYLCTAFEIPPSVRFVRAVSPEPGRADVIAYIDNPNTDATVLNAQYTVQLYGANEQLLAQQKGTVNLPPGSTAPVFLPNLYKGHTPVTQAFLTFDKSSLQWIRSINKPVLPLLSGIQIQDGPTPKINANITNPNSFDAGTVTVVATVFDPANNAIGASQTVLPSFAARSTVPLVFTWNQEFPGIPARVEILPATGP